MEEEKKLRRSRHNRWIGGVCGGLGEFFGLSAFWFRRARSNWSLEGRRPSGATQLWR